MRRFKIRIGNRLRGDGRQKHVACKSTKRYLNINALEFLCARKFFAFGAVILMKLECNVRNAVLHHVQVGPLKFVGGAGMFGKKLHVSTELMNLCSYV